MQWTWNCWNFVANLRFGRNLNFRKLSSNVHFNHNSKKNFEQLWIFKTMLSSVKTSIETFWWSLTLFVIDDLYIIGAVCVSVCHKSHYFCIQRIWSFLMFPDTFRTQRIWSFQCFLTHLYSKELVISMFLDTFHNQKCLKTVKRQNPLNYSKNLVISPVSGHFTYSKVSRKSKKTKSLAVFKEFGQFSCF